MKLLNTLKQAVSKNPDKARGAIDKAADLAEGRAGRKHRKKIDQASTKAKDYVDGMGGTPKGRGRGRRGA